MSTFIHSAAMTLLSKTLQTLLYKYLSDVDVEGVNLPSPFLYGSSASAAVGGAGGTGSSSGKSDGHSGWGVRLSNIRLKTGAKLMELPGQPANQMRKSKLRKRRERKAERRKLRKQAEALRKERIAQKRQQQRQQQHEEDAAHEAAEKETQQQEQAGGQGDNPNAVDQQQSTASRLYSWLSWSRSSSAIPEGESPGNATDSQNVSEKYDDKGENEQHQEDFPDPLMGFVTNNQDDIERGDQEATKNDRSAVAEAEVIPNSPGQDMANNHDTTTTNDDDDEDDDDDEEKDDLYRYCNDDDDDEDQDFDDENNELDDLGPMVLSIGKMGRIGTLDVRLIGNELHVFIEDAFLTVEAVRVPRRKEPETGGVNDTDTASVVSNKSATSHQTSGTSTTPKLHRKSSAVSEGGTPTNKAEAAATTKPEPKTIADRILAFNPLAKLISTIPHLFLRDIRVRFIIRDSMEESRDNMDDTVVEFCCEFLSVTEDGEDFMARFTPTATTTSGAPPPAAPSSGSQQRQQQPKDEEEEDDDEYEDENDEDSAGEDPYNQNKFMVKRIRTGRGADGGIVVNIYPPLRGFKINQGPRWSRYSWNKATQYCVLRMAGVDMKARVFIGPVNGNDLLLSAEQWYGDEEGAGEGGGFYDDYSIDAMLFGGVDYIAPGPQPALPPIDEQQQQVIMDHGDDYDNRLWMQEGVATYRTDPNGIQSSKVASVFHRVARGLLPVVCKCNHLPCAICSECWVSPSHIMPKDHPLDESTPLPGLVVSLTMRDTLEINLDRTTLETLNDLMKLFSSKEEGEEEDEGREGPAQLTDEDVTTWGETEFDKAPDVDKMECVDQSESTSVLGLFSRSKQSADEKSLDGTKATLSVDQETIGPESGIPTVNHNDIESALPDEKEIIDDAFPTYMQPENIQFLGIHLADVVIRIHAMKPSGSHDEGLSFCYWDITGKCLTVDFQSLEDFEEENGITFQDVRVDIGNLSAKEIRGPEEKLFLNMGLRQRVVDFDEATIETLRSMEQASDRSAWPSTAASLLEVQPSLELLPYEERDRHGVQVRSITVSDAKSNKERSHLNIRMGPSSLDTEYSFIDEFSTAIIQVKATLLGAPPPENSNNVAASGEKNDTRPTSSDNNAIVEKEKCDSSMQYRVQLDGGHIRLAPTIELRMPLTAVSGSSGNNFYLETLLDHVNIIYGKPAPPKFFFEGGLSLQQIAELPEKVRLRVLLFLDDLKPLEKALCIKPEANSFLRCRAVNKGILRVAKRLARRLRAQSVPSSSAVTSATASRRQELVSELLKLDDDTLDDLLLTHQRNRMKGIHGTKR